MKAEYLLVDGYNIIFTWSKLKKLADVSLEQSRDKLIDILDEYQGIKKMCVIIVIKLN